MKYWLLAGFRGIPRAILAIPLTSIIATLMASFAATRPIAIFLAEDVSVDEDRNSLVAGI